MCVADMGIYYHINIQLELRRFVAASDPDVGMVQNKPTNSHLSDICEPGVMAEGCFVQQSMGETGDSVDLFAERAIAWAPQGGEDEGITLCSLSGLKHEETLLPEAA